MLSARELKEESQNFSQSKTPNVRLAAALTSEAKNRENKMTKMTKKKIYIRKIQHVVKQGKVRSKWSQEKHRKILPLRAKVAPTKQGSKCIPKYLDTMWYECKNSINCRETPYKSEKKRGGGLTKASLGKPQEQKT